MGIGVIRVSCPYDLQKKKKKKKIDHCSKRILKKIKLSNKDPSFLLIATCKAEFFILAFDSQKKKKNSFILVQRGCQGF